MSTLNIKFRAMLAKDVDAVEKMDLEILGSSIGRTALINELKLNPLAHYFVLEIIDTKVLIGHIGLWVDEKNAQILNFYVKPEYQGEGFGSLIIEHTLEYLLQIECENVTLEVRPSNKKALSLYDKFGFMKVAIRANYYENGEDAYLMLKKL
jgi:ribosomal-protein-alanine N-acetyltransferase